MESIITKLFTRFEGESECWTNRIYYEVSYEWAFNLIVKLELDSYEIYHLTTEHLHENTSWLIDKEETGYFMLMTEATRLDDFIPFYNGAGGTYAEAPTLELNGPILVVKQNGGMDI